LAHRTPKRFAVGAKVRVKNPGVDGIVAQVDDNPTALGEYWHTIHTQYGDRRDPGCNLELIPTPIGSSEEERSKATRERPAGLEKHEYALSLAANEKLPDNISTSSRPSAAVIRELVDAGLIKAIDASSMDGPAYLNPQITLAGRQYLAQLREQINPIPTESEMTNRTAAVETRSDATPWADIESEYGVSKRGLGKKLSFIKDQFKKNVIFRDIEHSFLLAQNGFYKPSVVLAGGVVEELLRLFLEHKNIKPDSNTLDSYIKCCENHGFIKDAIHNLADSVRQFRNIVHLEREKSAKYSISKATAKGAVSSIFTIANELVN
jgi:hypothetical protein